MDFIFPIHWAFLQSERTMASQAQARRHGNEHPLSLMGLLSPLCTPQLGKSAVSLLRALAPTPQGRGTCSGSSECGAPSLTWCSCWVLRARCWELGQSPQSCLSASGMRGPGQDSDCLPSQLQAHSSGLKGPASFRSPGWHPPRQTVALWAQKPAECRPSPRPQSIGSPTSGTQGPPPLSHQCCTPGTAWESKYL